MKPTVKITARKNIKFLIAVCLATGAAAFGVAAGKEKKKRSAKTCQNQIS